ncbi:MAG: hypothetical protein K8R73_05760 [Clostridiales bacterium]|nr:hypothetical protein [Clostridiales bacterium]
MDELINTYPDIEQFLKVLKDDESMDCFFENCCLTVKINLIGENIKIHTSQLDKICLYEKADAIPSFKYLNDYGIKFKNYFEICLLISHHSYTFFDDTNNWNTDPLKFKIGESQFELGPISSLLVLLTEPIYSDNNSAHYDFISFTSLKFSLGDQLNYKEEFSKALFYLNSYYLKPTGFHATLMHLELSIDDPLDIFYEYDAEDIFNKVPRKRIIKRKDFISIEPLNLYNEAVQKQGEQRFLLLYRILEFFIARAIKKKIADLRYDRSVFEEDIMTAINFRNEEHQLRNLILEVITSSNKKKLSEYCFNKGLIDSDDFGKVCLSLYSYRNSLVHAKETELNQTVFPNPFEEREQINSWLYVVDEIARKSIKKYNEIN